MEYTLPLDMLYKWETTTPDKAYLRQAIDDVWHTWTWRQVGDETRRMAQLAFCNKDPINTGNPLCD